MRIRNILAVALAVAFFPVFAMAAATAVVAAAPSTVVNLQHLVDLIFTIVGSLMTLVIIPWVAAKLLDKLHIDKQSVLAQRLLSAAQNAAALGLSQLQNVADAHASVDVKNQIAANGLHYVLDGGLKPIMDKLGVNEDHVQNMILAQVQKLLPAQIAAAPAAVLVPGVAATLASPPPPPPPVV